MKRIFTLLVAALLVTTALGGFVGGVGAQEENSTEPLSPPERVDNSTVDNSTAVVVLGEMYRGPVTPEGLSDYTYAGAYDTESQDVMNPAVVAGNAVASKHDLPVFYLEEVDNENQILPVVQVVSQLKRHNDLDSVILVGEDQRDNNRVAEVFLSYDIQIEDQIYHDAGADYATAASQITERAVLHQWESAENIILLPTTYQSTASLLAAYANESVDGTPVVFVNGYRSGPGGLENVQPIADYLGANTVDATRGETVDGVSLGDNNVGTPRETSFKSVDNSTETVVIVPQVDDRELRINRGISVGERDDSDISPIVFQAGQIGSVNKSGILFTKDSDTFGSDTREALSQVDDNATVFLVGYDSEVDDSMVVDATQAAPENATIENIVVRQEPFAHRHRLGLLTAGYPHGVMISDSEEVGTGYFVTMTNIGYEPVPELDNESVQMTWQGEVTGSTPRGDQGGEKWSVTYDEAVEPGDSFTVNLEGDEFTVWGHPTSLNYKISASGGFVNANQDLQSIPGLSQEASIILGLVVIALVLGGGYLAYRRGWHKGLIPEVNI